jgi:hypothetical protein
MTTSSTIDTDQELINLIRAQHKSIRRRAHKQFFRKVSRFAATAVVLAAPFIAAGFLTALGSASAIRLLLPIKA